MPETIEVVRALSLWQPWAWAVASGHKRIENRSWKPRNAIGTWVAIHASVTLDKGALARVEEIAGAKAKLVHGAILGVAKLVDVIPAGARRQAELEARDRVWFNGPYGWFFERAIEFADPVVCRGYQSLWHLKPSMRNQIQRRLDAVDSACVAPPGAG